ncbi:RagB/SusD family nutrient uptake outer membrane protein [Flagellimonas allohymeniacidonis]|uniref:RagB/SusD family nutrient uptake outer membrane protein n=1 Tax=Flagellimonas allohymeniacidonis TaxID=2517819 RepID=A0A4Q8QC60_9FLAO|nr:RagB/SusD family nutrient uptake outer membrane protein [Allomuricauda hymeniacidonis]TAI47982.1 RagB/SusD family nutrient uptake outer membrane protein [Allomuricauda hymeniacidonis]
MKRNRLKLIAPLALSLTVAVSCTNLEVDESDSIIRQDTGSEFTGVSDPASAVDGLFADMNNWHDDQDNFFALQEVSTDEHLVPTRGTDWGDNGIWRVLHNHTWDPSHQYLLNVWNNFNQSAFRASEVIDSRSNGTAEQVGQAQFVRAYATWVLLDLFGNVPFRGVDEGPEINPSVLSRTEAVALVIADLEAAITALPSAVAPSSDANKVASKAAARFLLARVLLNRHIYNGGSPDTADMNRVVTLVDEIAAEGYALQAGYFDIFRDTPDTETIWWLETSVGNRIFNGLHYNSTELGGGGWNGFSTLAEFYDMFEGDANSNRGSAGGPGLDGQEERRGFVPSAGIPFTSAEGTQDENSDGFEDGSNVGLGFLVGQQYNGDGSKITDRPGNDLAFTRDFPGLVGNNERTGIRVQKYAARYGAFNNHQIIFRYADAHLMKAEAILRGAGGGDATALVNELRTIRGATPIGAVSEADLLEERGRELYVEFVRRPDMIRFGQFTRDWEFKDASSVGDQKFELYPIPATALLSNPNLQQNPGY